MLRLKPATKKALALSGVANDWFVGAASVNTVGTRVNGRGLFQVPNSSLARRVNLLLVEVPDDGELTVRGAVEVAIEAARLLRAWRR